MFTPLVFQGKHVDRNKANEPFQIPACIRYCDLTASPGMFPVSIKDYTSHFALLIKGKTSHSGHRLTEIQYL